MYTAHDINADVFEKPPTLIYMSYEKRFIFSVKVVYAIGSSIRYSVIRATTEQKAKVSTSFSMVSPSKISFLI